MKNIVKNTFLVLAAALVAWGMTACKQDPHKYAVTKGQPVIKYVITTNPAAADSVITEASTEAVICIVGENLRSTKKVFFNDLQAIINTSFVTENTMVIEVPASIPGAVSDKIYFHAENGTIVEFPFHVAVPSPKATTTLCEWVKPGETGHIVGNYFVDDPNVPLTVVMPDGQNAEIAGFSQTTLDYIVPEGCTQSGLITIKTIYGSCQSNFVFNDNRNILFDWDGKGQALAAGSGWRSGASLVSSNKAGIPALDGNYICFGPAKLGPGATDVWDEDNFSFNYWPTSVAGGSPAPIDAFPEFAEILANNEWKSLKMKFELYVPKSSAWQAAGLGIYLTDFETVSNENMGNGFYTVATFPRAYYQPWAELGAEYYSDQWVTVTIPLTEFKYSNEGKECGLITADHLKGLTMYVWGGGQTGVECNPAIAVDNIRIVP